MTFFSLLALPSLSACFVNCGEGTEKVGDECVAVTPTDTAPEVDNAPVIALFAADVDTLEYNESVTFTAVVTHADGVDQIIGGTLRSGSGAIYGAFATSADESAYSMSVSWWHINQVNDINLTEGVDGSRPFTATFYDIDGDFVEATVDVGLSCDLQASCEGICGAACTE